MFFVVASWNSPDVLAFLLCFFFFLSPVSLSAVVSTNQVVSVFCFPGSVPWVIFSSLAIVI